MKTITATQARNRINKLIDETAEESKPIQITGGNTLSFIYSGYAGIDY